MTPRNTLLLAGVGGALLFGWGFIKYERDVGALTEKLAQNAAHIATLDSSLNIERAKLKRDTVRVFRQVDHTVVRLDSLVRSDTLKLTDTVKVTVEVVREIKATVLACRETVSECGRVAASEKARADTLETRVKLLEKARPSFFSRCGLSVGYGATDKSFGPALLAGCKVFP